MTLLKNTSASNMWKSVEYIYWNFQVMMRLELRFRFTAAQFPVHDWCFSAVSLNSTYKPFPPGFCFNLLDVSAAMFLHTLGWKHICVEVMCRSPLGHQKGVAACRFVRLQQRAWQAGWSRTRKTPATGCPRVDSDPWLQRPAGKLGPGASSPDACKQSPTFPERRINRKGKRGRSK